MENYGTSIMYNFIVCLNLTTRVSEINYSLMNILFLRYEGARTAEALAEFVNNEGGKHFLLIYFPSTIKLQF